MAILHAGIATFLQAPHVPPDREALREAGATVVGVATIVDRGARAAIEAAGLEYRSAYTLADLGLS